jgi:hypothetical protein
LNCQFGLVRYALSCWRISSARRLQVLGLATQVSTKGEQPTMSYCEHCEGQRFDRARVLRTLRQVREELRTTDPEASADEAILSALKAVRALEIPHLEPYDEQDEVVH